MALCRGASIMIASIGRFVSIFDRSGVDIWFS